MTAEAKKSNKIGNTKNYFKEVKSELKRVVWPTKNQLINYTITVLAFTLIVGIIIMVFDIAVLNILEKTGFIIK